MTSKTSISFKFSSLVEEQLYRMKKEFGDNFLSNHKKSIVTSLAYEKQHKGSFSFYFLFLSFHWFVCFFFFHLSTKFPVAETPQELQQRLNEAIARGDSTFHLQSPSYHFTHDTPFLIENARYLVIEGEGSEILFQIGAGLKILNCSFVTLNSISIDYDPPQYSQVHLFSSFFFNLSSGCYFGAFSSQDDSLSSFGELSCTRSSSESFIFCGNFCRVF